MLCKCKLFILFTYLTSVQYNYSDISNKLVAMKLFIHSVRGLSEVVSMMFSIDIPNIFIPPTYPELRLVHVCDNHFNILTLLLHCYNSKSNIFI